VRWECLVAASLFATFSCDPAHAAESDVYAPLPAKAAAVDGLIRAAMMGEPGAEPALGRWLDEHPQAPAEQRRRAARELCKDYGVRTLHALREPVCKTSHQQPAGDDDDGGMAAAFKGLPPVRAVGSTKVPLSWNPYGTESADVEVGGVSIPWIVDTGAEISVLTKTNADRIGVRYLKGRVTVGTSTEDVHGEVGVIDLMKIGEAYVENVPVLVLPDEQLTIGDAPTIPGILGLQVFNAFRRMAWLDEGRTLALGEAAPAVVAPTYRIYWHDEGLGVPVATKLGIMGAHLDTGANRTDLRPPGLALLTPEQRASATSKTVHTGGAGGVIVRQEQHLANLTVSLGGVPAVLKTVAVDSRSQDGAGRIGMDLVGQFASLVLDFEHMTLAATPSTRSPAERPPLAFFPELQKEEPQP
jgi:hypothetical protein